MPFHCSASLWLAPRAPRGRLHAGFRSRAREIDTNVLTPPDRLQHDTRIMMCSKCWYAHVMEPWKTAKLLSLYFRPHTYTALLKKATGERAHDISQGAIFSSELHRRRKCTGPPCFDRGTEPYHGMFAWFSIFISRLSSETVSPCHCLGLKKWCSRPFKLSSRSPTGAATTPGSLCHSFWHL